MVEQDKFGFRTRALMQDAEPDPEEQTRALELSQSIGVWYEMQETFHSKGWPRINEWLEDGIAAAQALILSGRYEDDPKGSAELRGQIRSYKALMDLPARVRAEIEMAEQELNERP